MGAEKRDENWARNERTKGKQGPDIQYRTRETEREWGAWAYFIKEYLHYTIEHF